jgi:AraC family transcriptional regulator
MLDVAELQDTPVAIERVIAAMRTPDPEVRTLSEMAELACLSRFHFCRVFHRAAGIPPAAFFSALRLDQAKRLLLNTDVSVTEICFALGYSSLGAFTTRFSHHVGVSPGRFRQLLGTTREALVELERDEGRPQFWPDVAPAISGTVVDATGAGGPTFVGLFPHAMAQGRPISGTAFTRPGPYSLPLPPAGRYALLAVSLPQHCDAISALAPDASSLVGSAATPIVVQGNRVYGSTAISLRRFLPTDPPVLVALPPLLLRRETRLAETTGWP